MLLKKLVEQHGVYRLITDGVNLALAIADHQVGVYRSYVLGDQTKLRDAVGIAFIVERHRFEREERVAGGGHISDVLLKAPRGARRAQLPGGVDINRV